MTNRRAEDKFERTWLAKFAYSLYEVAGEEIRQEVMHGSESLSETSDPLERVLWSVLAMERLESLVSNEDDQKDIMNNCACFYFPLHGWLEEFQVKYQEMNNLDALHAWMSQRFHTRIMKFLKEFNAPETFIQKVEAKHWGEVGRKEGNTIFHTKMPYNLKGYLDATTAEEKRYHYCHCPRIRAVLESPENKLSSLYCYCGGGFYTSLWEGIIGKPVTIELLKSVQKGDDECSFAVHLPLD